MSDVKKPVPSGSAGWNIFKAVCALLLVAAAVSFVKWFIGIVMWIWGLIKLGFITAGRFLVVLAGLVALSFIIALICDALAPLFRRIKQNREIRRAMARCRMPSLRAFRTGKSAMEGEAGKIDRFMASLLRQRYEQMTGFLPDKNTFHNNESSYAAFKAGELPSALLAARTQVEQDIFSPLIAAYRMGDSAEPRGEK